MSSRRSEELPPRLNNYGSFGALDPPPPTTTRTTDVDEDHSHRVLLHHRGPHQSLEFSTGTPLLDAVVDDHHHKSFPSKQYRRRWIIANRLVRFGLVGVTILFLGSVLHFRRSIWFMVRYRGHPRYKHVSHGSTVPTLLSVRHHTDGILVNALKNHVYDDLRSATLRYDSNSEIRRQLEPNIRLTAELKDKSLLVQWSSSTTSDSDSDSDDVSVFQPTDILALYCSNDNDNDDGLDVSKIRSTHQFLEMATLEQVQATHKETMRRLDTNYDTEEEEEEHDQAENSWFMESFPVRRFSVCQFLLYRQEQQDEAIQLHYMASSTPIRLNSVTTPAGIHLSATVRPTEMVVSFSTGAVSGTPVVVYGPGEATNSNKDFRVTGTTTTYKASDLCMEPANQTEPGKFVDPGSLHTVRMTNLRPNTTYHYQVGLQHGQGVTWSDTYSFISPLPVGDTSPFTYLVYGDQGCPETGWTTGAAWTAALAAHELPTIRQVHHFGDLSYAKGAAHIWDAWLDMIEPVASRIPYHVAVGNHEYDYLTGGTNKDPSGVENDNGFHPDWGNFGNDSGGECGLPTVKRFTMPQSGEDNQNPSNSVFWYSHDFGLVHTVVLSSEHDMSPGSRQYGWLVADLQAVNRALTPWIVLELHRSMYESETFWDQNAVGIGERYEIENVLFDYNVDLVLTGHYHAYLRSCDGLFRNHCNRGGPTHITVGTAGAALDESSLYETEWTVQYIQGVFGYGRITVANATALLFEFVRAGDADEQTTGDVLDHVWLKRNR